MARPVPAAKGEGGRTRLKARGWNGARARLPFLALLFILVTPVASQDDVYFSLSTNRTFAPGEKPAINLWASNVEALEFRVYRVNDPVLFFQKLEDVHRFGEHVHRPERERTLLERFHRFKREWRNCVRDLFRMQFSPMWRAQIRSWMTEEPEKPQGPKVTTYAQVPVLNQKQLVAVWQQQLPQVERWESQTIPIEVSDKGLYLVEAVHGQLRAYTVVLITGMAVISKGAPGHILSYAVDPKTGAPIEGASVLVWSGDKEVSNQATDAQGLVETRLKELQPENATVLARHGDDFAVDSLYAWYLNSDPERHLVGYVYTDRPVYRPGHTVYWKAILRTQSGPSYALPERREVQVEVQDSEGKAVVRQTAKVSATGTVNGEFALQPAAALGYYSIEVKVGENDVRGGFNVEEYKKPEYEVRVAPAAPRVLQGQDIQATLQARYYFGEPVANAKVTYVVHRTRYWYPLYYDEEEAEFESAEGDDYYGGEQILEETGQLDAEGRLTVRIPTRVNDGQYDERYRVEARVTDQGNREIAGFSSVLATYGSFMVNIQPNQYVFEPGARASFTIEARDYDGKPVPTRVRAQLFRWDWDRPEKERSDKPLATVEATTDATGSVQVQLPVGSGGSMNVRATARTPEGREVQDRTWIWVTGRGSWWSGTNRERLQIVPDKKSYQPGEVAKILIVTGTPDAHLLVTAEGQGLYSRQVVAANGPTVTVEVPIRAEYAPNFFVSAVFVRENQLYQGSKSVKVPATEKQLTVELASSKAEYKPGESGVVTLAARDHAGQPVAGEFSLGIVDEAIYAIRPEPAPEIFGFFYGRVYNRVNTDTSLSYYFYGYAGKRSMQLTRLRRPTTLAQLKPERLVEPKVRKAFPDTILWLADLQTDANGHGQARVTFPDSLTTWRITARGVTRNTHVGSAVQRTLVRKNLILRLAVPRFFTQGDEVRISAIVHNYLQKEKTARVSLAVDGLEIIEGATQDVAIPSRGEATVNFRVRAPSGQTLAPREAKLLSKALTDEESDALELTLPVIPFGVKLSEARAGSVVEASGEALAELKFPRPIVPSSKTLEVRVAPSVAGAIFSALEYLTTYPYGCVEQTMSSFLPNIVVAQALKELGVKSKIDPVELEKKIRKGQERLYDFQHSDGGWGWWQTDESNPFMTAYVIAGLVQARAAGYDVRDGVLERGAGWLRAELKKEKLEPDVRAYIVYALALTGDKDRARLDSAWEQRGRMTPYGLALLGLALEVAGDSRAVQAAEQLERQAKADDTEAYWEATRDTLLDFPGDASPEATAHALKLLARQRPQSPLLPKAALWLVNHRDQGYYWYSTKQTAMVIYGLTDYLKLRGELKPNYSLKVWVNDKEVLSRRFSEADVLATDTPVVQLTAEQLGSETARVRITKSGPGVLYWSARIEYYSTQEKLERMGRVSLNLLRDYYRLVPERTGESIVYNLQPLEGPLQTGDVLAVRLTLSGGSWRYLMIEDPIPAGTEFIERDDLYAVQQKPTWWNYGFTRREFHDDHAAFFDTYFPSGQTQYVYLLKVVNPGRFRVSPARAQPMYQPQYLTTSESKTVEVK